VATAVPRVKRPVSETGEGVDLERGPGNRSQRRMRCGVPAYAQYRV
jgi:hypothetical protein